MAADFIEYTKPFWRDLNMRQLGVDEAYLNIKSEYNDSTYLYMLTDDCHTCPFTKIGNLAPFGNETNDILKINVARALKFKALDIDVGRYEFGNRSKLCEVNGKDMREFGVYNLTVKANGTCEFSIDKDGVNSYLSILSCFILIAILLSIIRIIRCFWRRDEMTTIGIDASSQSPDDVTTKRQIQRMHSLDTFRGIAIVLMIFVNSGGGSYWWIEHATWDGLHLADVVFPSFLWIMGVCIPISVKSHLAHDTTKTQLCAKVIWRSMKLFFIGLCLNTMSGPQLEMLRIMGVLQRFGIAYLICGVLHVCFRSNISTMPKETSAGAFYDLKLLKAELLVMLLLICVHLGIMFGLYVPDCPKGYLGPGGKHSYAAYPQCIGGAAGHIDRQILGEAHIYQYSIAKQVYDSRPFDPENVFGCLLTVVQVLFGLIAGMIIIIHKQWLSRIGRWLSWSVLLALLGGLLCLFSKHDGYIPINKNLWSLSFVFVTVSLAFALLAIIYLLVDVSHLWSGFPFKQSGKNAIILYVGHTILNKMMPWHWRIGEMNTHFILLIESIWNTLLWIVIALYLDAKKFYYNL